MEAATPIETLGPFDWHEGIAALAGCAANHAFRAERPSAVALKSSFDREAERSGVEAGRRWMYEGWILREFRRRAYHYLSGAQVPERDDALEWLSLMRHYGAPCRLLDFTYSYNVAAYFALDGARRADEADEPACAVWMVDLNWVDAQSRDLIRMWKTPRGHALVGWDPATMDVHLPEVFSRFFFDPNPVRSVVAANPFRLNERLAQQQGLFLCPGDISVSFDRNLRAMNGCAGSVRRVLLRADRANVKTAVNYFLQMNVSAATLFPDLQGYAQSLADWFYRDYVSDDRLEPNIRAALTYGGADI